MLLVTFSFQSLIITINSDAECDREVTGTYYNDSDNLLDPFTGI